VNEEEHWLKSTKCNTMVHDLGENKHENEEEQRVGDKDFIERTLKQQMGFDVTIIKVERIGARKDEMYTNERWRPLKVILKSEEERIRILASAHKLNKDDDFRVSDDFSRKEREIIKQWHRKAKEKTSKEEDKSHIRKVRGSPRTKLYLKKFTTETT